MLIEGVKVQRIRKIHNASLYFTKNYSDWFSITKGTCYYIFKLLFQQI